METTWLFILGLSFCLAVSFLLSGMEAGVFALSRLRIRQQMRAGNPSARLLHGYLEGPENFLWTILAGNTLANFIVVSLTALALHRWYGRQPAVFIGLFVLAVFLFYALCDLLPKMLFRLYPNRLCLWLVRPFRFIHLALSPLVRSLELCSDWLLQWTGGKMFTGHLFGSRDELRFVMQESAQGFSSEERTMINRVLDMQNLTVQQITKPMVEVVAVGSQTPLRDVLALSRERGFTRLPVCENTAAGQRVMGILSLRKLLFQADLDLNKPAGEWVTPALFLEADLRLDQAMQRMRRGGQRLAIVVGRDQRELGIVSLQDILKVIFGEVSL